MNSIKTNVNFEDYKIYLFVLIPMLFWSSHSVFAKYIMAHGGGVFEIIFYRSLGAMIVFSYMLNPRRLLTYSYKAWIPGFVFFLNMVMFHYALQYIDAYIVMVLEASCFVFSFYVDRLLKKRVTLSKPATIIFVIGLSLLLYQSLISESSLHLMGLAFAIVTSLFFGMFNSTLYLVSETKDKNILVMAPMFILSIPFFIYESSSSVLEVSDIMLIVIVLGAIQSGATIYCWTKASQYFSGTTLSLFFLLTLPGTLLTEWLILGVDFNVLMMSAALLITISVIINVKMIQRTD